MVGSDTEYEKREKNNHYGIKCKVIGYEWSNDSQQVWHTISDQLVSFLSC